MAEMYQEDCQLLGVGGETLAIFDHHGRCHERRLLRSDHLTDST
jgi:hypothetical protein